MTRYAARHPNRFWSKLKSRVEALFVPGLQLAIHCNVFIKVTRHWKFNEPRHWVVLGCGRDGRIIWDFPGPSLRPGRDEPPRSSRGPTVDPREAGNGWEGRKPSEPSALMRDYLDRPREQLMQPFENSWGLGAILRAADRRLGRDCLLAWAAELDSDHPTLRVIDARFGSRTDRSSRVTAFATPSDVTARATSGAYGVAERNG